MQNVKEESIVKTYRDLNAYQLSYALTVEIFELTRRFPASEMDSLVDQMRISSRSISSAISEGWARRRFKDVFIKQAVDSQGFCEETKFWLDCARDCNYISGKEHQRLISKYNEVGAMLTALINNWQAF